MSVQAIEQQFLAVQEQFERVSAALEEGDSERLCAGSESLHQLAVAILQLMEQLSPHEVQAADLRTRLQEMARKMTDLRLHMVRRANHVDRAVAVLMPQAVSDPTYAEGNTPYGGVARSSGQLRSVSA